MVEDDEWEKEGVWKRGPPAPSGCGSHVPAMVVPEAGSYWQ
eukprot:COSAG01_NODE_2631_length_7340_cov_35.191686_1_plen_41_part_00